MSRLHIGLSGWSYPSWRGDFYPAELRRGEELAFASRRFDSVEVNGSFYSLLTPRTYAHWHASVPPGFVFALKGSRFVTHVKRLAGVESVLANFFASGVLRLDEKLGPFLWQLPDTFPFDPERLEAFLALLPRDTGAAEELARRHDARVAGRAWTIAGRRRKLRHVLEVRHPSWMAAEPARILRRHNVALAVSDSADWPRVEEPTAGFVYLRLHGARETYASAYSDTELDRWADRIRRWLAGEVPDDAQRLTDLRPPPRKGYDVYAYFDNDQHGNAPRDAARLAERLKVPV